MTKGQWRRRSHRHVESAFVRRRMGFTLVEVMVAMAVVAVALPALLLALNQQIDGTAYLRERTLAGWVASNQLSTLRLLHARNGQLPQGLLNGELSGEQRLADRDWFWWARANATALPGFVQVEIEVAADPDREQPSLQRLTAFFAVEGARAGP